MASAAEQTFGVFRLLQLKKVLSANAEATIQVESLAEDLDVSGKMTREEFEELAKPLGARITAPLQRVGSIFPAMFLALVMECCRKA